LCSVDWGLSHGISGTTMFCGTWCASLLSFRTMGTVVHGTTVVFGSPNKCGKWRERHNWPVFVHWPHLRVRREQTNSGSEPCLRQYLARMKNKERDYTSWYRWNSQGCGLRRTGSISLCRL
jgi:hypothetical protein